MRIQKEVIHSETVPTSTLYSQAVKVGNTVFLSGIAAFDPVTKRIEAATIEEQTDQAIRNCQAILRAAHAELSDVVRVTILLKDPAHFDRMNAAYSKHFSVDPPTRAVAKLGVELPNVLISIMMTAVMLNDSDEGPTALDA
jgi:2-iminobutanoate/2-iminopropanoate deaminase